MTNSEKILQFMKLFKQSCGIDIFENSSDVARLLALRLRLVEEEAAELRDAVNAFAVWGMLGRRDARADAAQREAFAEIIDALADILYVTYGFFHAFGLDPDAALDIVHRSNLSKLTVDARPILREDGKVLKGPLYQPPDFSEIVRKYGS